MKHIVCFHLLNDFSGSPKVLRMVLGGMLDRGHHVELVTTRGGVLDDLVQNPACKLHSYNYRFSTNGMVEILRYGWIQLYTFFFAFRWLLQKDVVFYINTLLPIGPALAGKLMGKKVVYHYHENADAKSGIYRVLCSLMQKLADEIICVSQYQRSFLKRTDHVHVIHNSLPSEFVAKLQPNIDAAFERKNVLMLGSLKAYKGVREFCQLADSLPQYHFTLVINDEQEKIDQYFKDEAIAISDNIKVYARHADVSAFYNQASLVLNLSNKELFVETFGLTALEAMSAALPVIVPTVGGIAEMVEDGVNGYRIDVQDLKLIERKIGEILSDQSLYRQLAAHALVVSSRFDEQRMVDEIIKVVFSQ